MFWLRDLVSLAVIVLTIWVGFNLDPARLNAALAAAEQIEAEASR